MKRIGILLLLVVTTGFSPGRPNSALRVEKSIPGGEPGLPAARSLQTIQVPRGSAIQIDGYIASKEWDRTAVAPIPVRVDWKAHVRLKHDDKFLYFLFEGVQHGGERLFPEIVIDPKNRRADHWENGQWWFHVSANLCEGYGEPNVYTKDGVFQCAHLKDGWAGNNPPASNTTNIEIKVSFAKLDMRATPGLRFGLALALTDATGDSKQKWFFWPKPGQIDFPATWGVAVLE